LGTYALGSRCQDWAKKGKFSLRQKSA
jgi:hypothetical protein